VFSKQIVNCFLIQRIHSFEDSASLTFREYWPNIDNILKELKIKWSTPKLNKNGDLDDFHPKNTNICENGEGEKAKK
jgi:hypothetical protein